jgi:GNAT superfamily N-acetyltransferase
MIAQQQEAYEAEIRRATPAELRVALPLLERFFAEEGFGTPFEQMRAGLAGLLSDEESAVFVAWLDAVAVGVATVTTSSGIEFGLSAELEDLYVVPEARGRGVGGKLIEAVINWCRLKRCTILAAMVTPEGQAAHDLIGYYAAHGFRETGRTLLYAHLGCTPRDENEYESRSSQVVARRIRQPMQG